jgi:hypothetical protein
MSEDLSSTSLHSETTRVYSCFARSSPLAAYQFLVQGAFQQEGAWMQVYEALSY